jgi:hypothetical protein
VAPKDKAMAAKKQEAPDDATPMSEYDKQRQRGKQPMTPSQ